MTVAETTSPKLVTGHRSPALEVPTLTGTTWQLTEQTPTNFSAIVFYRGRFCPICQSYLTELDRHMSEFDRLGVDLIAISGDSQAEVQKAQQEWGLQHLLLRATSS